MTTVMALVWLWSRQIPLAILPFAVYSVFHVLTYTRANVLPALQPPQQQQQQQQPSATSPAAKPKPSGLSDSIGRFVKEYYDSSMSLVAVLEIVLWFRLLGSAFLFTKGSWILLAIYTIFFRARYSQSSFVQGAISQLTARLDAQLANQSTPPALRHGWESVKDLVRRAADATDINRMASQQSQGPKKAQ